MTTGASLNITIADSEASNNVDAGVGASSLSGHAATDVMLRNGVASYNTTGLLADGGNSDITIVNFRVAHSVVTGNGTGVFTAGGGAIFSYGDNDIDGNANDNTGVLTSLAMH